MATYTVKSGDTFGEIANQYGLSTSELQRINPQLRNINVIEVGDQIIVPGQTAMDLSATDIVDTGGQTQTIQRQPVRRSQQLSTSQTDKVADLKLINPDSSLILERLTKVKEGRGLTGFVDVGKEMLLESAPKIMPGVYGDEAKAQEPEQKISATDALIEKGGEVVKDLIMPEETEAEPNLEVGPQAIATAEALQQEPAVEAIPKEEEETETDVVKITNPEDVKKVVQDEKTADAIIEYGNTNFMFEDGLDKSALERIDKEIQKNNEKLTEISQGKLKPYFGKEDTGRKFLAAIAAGLGAYASAMTGTPNFALNIINKAIDDDLAIQKEELERQRLSILDQNKILAESRAELYAEADRLFNQQVTVAGLQLDQEQINTTKEGIAQRREQAELENIQAKIDADLEAVESFNNRYVPGYGVTAYTDEKLRNEVVSEARKQIKDDQTIRRHSDVARSVLKGATGRGKVFAAIPLTAERQKLQTALAEIANLYRQGILELGTQFTQFEGPFLSNIIDKDIRIRDLAVGRIERMLDNLETGMQAKKEGIMKSGRFTPTEKEKKTDKSYEDFLEKVSN